MASEILRMMIDTEAFSNEMVRATPMLFHLRKHITNIVMVYSLNKITQSNNFLKLSENI